MKACKAAGIAIFLLGVPVIQGCFGVVATGTAASAVAAQDRRTPGTFIDDELIELKVLAAIFDDESMSSQTHINATSVNGLVLLTGEAPGESLRTRITEIARGITKVRAVQNEIALEAAEHAHREGQRYGSDRQGQSRAAPGQGDQCSASQGGHRGGHRLPHGTSQTRRGRPRNGNIAARGRRSTCRESHGVHRIIRTCLMFRNSRLLHYFETGFSARLRRRTIVTGIGE